MSRLISSHRATSNGSPAPPPPLHNARSATMEPVVVASGIPDVTQALESSTSSVALPPSSRRTHRRACTLDRHRHPHPMSIAPTQTNYNFDDINESMDNYLNMLFSGWYKQWKSDLHKHFELFNDLEAAIEESCQLDGGPD
ncbi:hypothetical protein C1H46_028467 [Malus baccata]|uniref:Uncharacterized protein n=1 Tax=Malus baccata TaxID=106549 RepID=A0A540LHP0_MALBA|nr:hypothetical protein C1H46_028467 [Malus baccata]